MNKLYHLRVISDPNILLGDAPTLDAPERVNDFINKVVKEDIVYNPEKENGIVLFLNTRRKIIGYEIIGNGTLDTLIMHPREVFRSAIARNAHAIIIAHNHPSGETTPSEPDIKVTRELIKSGQILKLNVLDHVIFSSLDDKFTSLRELGYIFS